ncbi:MAG: hypothetical protein IJF64_04230, partial [Clostridia bacterium]|nr:hypothetical protein [Clostridia bacterium]
MDNYERQLVESALELLHRLVGYADSKEDFKPILRLFPGSEPTEKENPDSGELSGSEQGFVEFTQKEIQQMPQSFRRLIVIQKKRCRMRKHVCGKNFTYEIRSRADGYNVSACGKTIERSKQNFLEKLQTAKPKERDYFGFDVPRTFHAFSTYYFETFRKEKVKEKTFKKDMLRYRKYLQPYFKEIPLSKIHPGQCRDLLREVNQIGKGKTSDELYSLMNCIFKNAIAHNLMERNPLDVVLHIQHPSESGKALTREEENVLLEAV